MSLNDAIKRLKQVSASSARTASEIGTEQGASLTLPQDAKDKLFYLQRGGRDFVTKEGKMRRELSAAFAAAARKAIDGEKPADEPWKAAAAAFRNRLELRLRLNGDDVSGRIAPLERSTVRQKGSRRVGVDTGKLLRDVRNAGIKKSR